MKTSSTSISLTSSKEDTKKEYAEVRTKYRQDMLVNSKNSKARINLNMRFAKDSARIFTSVLSKLEIAIINDDLSTLQVMIS